MTTEAKHESRRLARMFMMNAAAELRESMSAESWLQEATLDPLAINAYGGDVEALRREASAIVALMWGV